jgi:hypothetical protein
MNSNETTEIQTYSIQSDNISQLIGGTEVESGVIDCSSFKAINSERTRS